MMSQTGYTVLFFIVLCMDGLLWASPPTAVHTQALSQLVLNEFLADPPPGIAGDANGDGVRVFQEDEFVEFFNNGPFPVDLSGYKVWDQSAVRHIFPAGTVLAPYQALVVFGRPSAGGNQGDFGGALVQNCSQSSIGAGDGLSLANGGDRIGLTTPQDSFVINYLYGSANVDQSLTRFPDLSGATPSLPHSTVSSSGLLFSPGKTVDGTPFFLRTPSFDQQQLMVDEGTSMLTIDISLDGVVPVSDSTISVDVVLATGDPADLNGFQRQTVVFPSGSRASQQISLMIRDDSLQEEEETFVFKLTHLQGDPQASLDERDSLVVYVLDNDQAIAVGFERSASTIPYYRQGIYIPVDVSQSNFLQPIEVIISLAYGDSSLISDFTSDTLRFAPGSTTHLDIPILFTPGLSFNRDISIGFEITAVNGSNRNGIPVATRTKRHELTITPRTGTHFFYVDPFDGDDTNDGRSPATAWESLFNLNLGSDLPPNSRILLRADSYFAGQLSPRGSGNGPDSLIILDMYGLGNKPIIDGAGFTGGGVVQLYNQSYWEIRNLEIVNQASAQGDRKGVAVLAENAGIIRHIHLRDLHIHDISGIPASDNSGKRTGGIYIATVDDEFIATRFDDILIEGCTIHDCENQGIVTNNEAGVSFRPDDPLFEQRKFTHVRIRNNVIYNISKNAMIIRLTDGGLIEYNLCYNTALNGITGNTMFCRTTRNTVFQFNEGYRNQSPGIDGSMYDPDLSTFGSVFQYSYSHDNNQGMVWYATEPWDRDIVVRYNISQNDRGYLIALRSDFVNTRIYNNVFYIGPNVSPIIIHERAGRRFDLGFFNNIIYNLSPSAVYERSENATREIDHNLFFGFHPASEPSDANKITADPLLVQPGSATTGLASLDGYKLLQQSPALGSGRIIPDNGQRDYFGHYVWPDRAPNVGAYNGPGLDTASVGPLLVTNLGLRIAVGDTAGILPDRLKVVDPDHQPNQLSYQILETPVAGKLMLRGTTLVGNDTFTQADIDDGSITYVQDKAGFIGDVMVFEVSDPTGLKTDSILFIVDIQGLSSRPPGMPKLSLVVSPNPAFEDLHIHVAGAYYGPMYLYMLDIKGQEVLHYPFEKSETEWATSIDCEAIPRGVYFLRVMAQDRLMSSKGIILK